MIMKKILTSGKRIFTVVRGSEVLGSRPLRYYLEHPGRRGTSLARWLDYGVLLAIIWLAGFLLLEQLTGSPQHALAASTVIPVAGFIFITRRWRHQARLRHKISLLQAAGKNCLAELETMPAWQFSDLVRELLLHKEIYLEVPAQKTGGDYFGAYKEQRLMVRCLPSRAGAKVAASEVAEFVGLLAARGYKRGLLVAAGEFTREAVDIKARLANSFHLEYIDLTALADLARKAKHPVFPEPSEKLLREQSRFFSAERLKSMLFGTRAKTKSYIFAATILMSFYLLQQDLIFAPLYVFLALLNLFMAAACLVFAPARGEGDKDWAAQ